MVELEVKRQVLRLARCRHKWSSRTEPTQSNAANGVPCGQLPFPSGEREHYREILYQNRPRQYSDRIRPG